MNFYHYLLLLDYVCTFLCMNYALYARLGIALTFLAPIEMFFGTLT